MCSWRVLDDPMGSDHLPIFIGVEENVKGIRQDKIERSKLILTRFSDELFIKYLKESFATENISGANGAVLYEEWYRKVILCCLKAGAVIRETSGNILSFDKDRLNC